MNWLNRTKIGLIRGRSAYTTIVPGISALFASKLVASAIKLGMNTGFTLKSLHDEISNKTPISEITGSIFGGMVLHHVMHTPRKAFIRSFSIPRRHRPLGAPLGASQRTWVNEIDKSIVNDRVVKDVRIMYHDTNKVGKHLDCHIGHQSIVIRVSGKPVEAQLKFNSEGYLTQNSKDLLMDHLRAEIKNNSRVVWNHDHTMANAAMSWVGGSREDVGYGAGVTRQLVMQDKGELYHIPLKSSQHWYIPKINPDQGTYMYQIYPGTEKTAPILIWGNLIPLDERFQDRLHLQLIQPEDLSTFISKSDPTTTTRKYDGASTYFSSNGQGFKFFSPRYSKVTGHRIEYTYKLSEMTEIGHPDKPIGMGELMFWKYNGIFNLLKLFDIRGPERICWKYLPAASIGGVLNSNSVRPIDVYPEVNIYRIDKYLGQNTTMLPFFQNRVLQEQVAEVNPDYFQVVRFCTPKKYTDWEGMVAVPQGLSVNDGLKLKFRGDENDMTISSIDLSLSKKGYIQGTISAQFNGRTYNFGSGQIGSFDDCMSIMDNPEKYIGRVIKVRPQRGGVARAAKIVAIHLDK